MNKTDKMLALIKRNLQDNMVPILVGAAGGLMVLVIQKHTISTMIIILTIAAFISLSNWYLKRKYPQKCPFCGKFIKKIKN